MPRTPILVPVLCLLIACAGPVGYHTQVESPGDVSVHATYVHAPTPDDRSDAPQYTPEVGARITETIGRGLGEKGYRAGSEGAADFQIAFVVTGHSVFRRVNAGDPDVDFYIDREYTEGTLVIFALDASGRTLWRGSAEIDFPTSGALIPPNFERITSRAARHLMSRFPASRAQ